MVLVLPVVLIAAVSVADVSIVVPLVSLLVIVVAVVPVGVGAVGGEDLLIRSKLKANAISRIRRTTIRSLFLISGESIDTAQSLPLR